MHNEQPPDYTCPICQFVREEERDPISSNLNDLVVRNNDAMAIISVHQWPNNPGNVIVFPVDHYENIFDLPDSAAANIHALSHIVALAMKAAWKCDGVSTRQHNGKAGNQDVWHYHLHVTPRYSGDELYATYTSAALIMSPDERDELARELRTEASLIDNSTS